MSMLSMNELKLGRVVVMNNEPYQLVATQHIKVARGGAVLKTKLKNLINQSTLEKTFAAADKIAEADLAHRQANFLYRERDSFFFMDNENFEQYHFTHDAVGDQSQYLSEGQEVDVLIFNGNPVAVALPTKIICEVASAPEGVRGNSSGAVTKTVTLTSGAEIRTPLFIKAGDKITVNIETGEYVSRA